VSIPRRDPAMTVEELRKYARKFLDAGYEYWQAAKKAGVSGAVIWLTDADGRMVLITRGEYRHTIMQNIDRIGGTQDVSFGANGEEE
jgi:hypothetical protein